MAEQDNTFLTANDIYEDVEGETGKNLNLEATQQSNLLGLIKSRFASAEEKKDIYQKIRLTLRGQFHSIVFSKLEEMGLDIDTIEMEDPLTLLMEAKNKYERQQLNSSNR